MARFPDEDLADMKRNRKVRSCFLWLTRTLTQNIINSIANTQPYKPKFIVSELS